ncbi:MAG: hypothetical protein HYV42_04115 [Candidatus Magasanikbacteria bacterium]|nr:hypothetical protein [Candidatus Magasanikbacteria bacterium]
MNAAKHLIDPENDFLCSCGETHPPLDRYADGNVLVKLNGTGAYALGWAVVEGTRPLIRIDPRVMREHCINGDGRCSCGHRHPVIPGHADCFTVHYAVDGEGQPQELAEVAEDDGVRVFYATAVAA